MTKTVPYTIQFDPLGAYPSTEPSALVEATGFLAPWALEWAANPAPTEDLPSHMEACYGFGELHRLEGGTINPDGTFSYPGDPDLSPIMKLSAHGETFYVYPHAIVAFLSEYSTFVSRMD